MLFWLGPLLVLAAISVPLAVTDLTAWRLPNVLLLPGYIAFAVSAALRPATGGEPTPMLVCFVALGGVSCLSLLGAIGMGDVKLIGLLAGCLELLPSANAPPLLAIAAGSTLLLVAPAAIVASAYGRRTIALGPFLLAGFWLAVLV
ncbi:prepilin peptidase [Subtercola endophyticus]|uniref:prepilin peptidase n=1 Tax=Subtercola endophyticus TaxID=2895559 RepID=UPI001E3EE6A5|nr:prepilin peptidase [Subtercola endophyticus]UFS59870.1 prepilin peptidase [Subtercola endophyticus]